MDRGPPKHGNGLEVRRVVPVELHVLWPFQQRHEAHIVPLVSMCGDG